MPHVLISISHRHDSPFVWVEHKEFSVTDLAYFASNFITILKLNWAWECSRSRATVAAVEHGTELARHSFLQLFFAGEAVSLILHYFVTRCVIFHFKFEYDFVWIEGVWRAKHTYCHYLLHLASLFASQAFVLFLNFHVSLIGQTRLRHDFVAVARYAWDGGKGRSSRFLCPSVWALTRSSASCSWDHYFC